jgi:hypothetical protein
MKDRPIEDGFIDIVIGIWLSTAPSPSSSAVSVEVSSSVGSTSVLYGARRPTR